MNRLIIFLIILITYFLKRTEQNYYLNSIKLNFKKIYIQYFIYFVFCYLSLFEYSILFTTFINNIILHHGLAVEMLSANYFGIIKFPNHYSNTIGPYHLLSNASLASLNIFSINPNLHLILETKMLLKVIFFSSFLFFVSKKIRNKNKIFFVSLIVYLIFYSEIKYNYTIGSNYLFFIFSICLVQIIFDKIYNIMKRYTYSY